MPDSQIPDFSVVTSPPRRDISYTDLHTECPIGAGGNADVYKATLSTTDPPDRVALKEPNERGTLNRDTIDQFLNEAGTWETLDRYERDKLRWTDYEHIVGIIDTGDNLPWIAMEYMDGGSLQDRLDNESDGLPLNEALWVGECICRGIELAHNYGIAHLDLKPANILFRETPTGVWDMPKVADWGLARLLAKETGTLDGLSVEYAAPEQFEPNEFGDPDTLTDIYQVGGIVYALVTGTPPFTGSQTSIMYDIVHGHMPTPPSSIREECPEELDQVIETALAHTKTDRYRTISEFEKALNNIRTEQQSDSAATQPVNTTNKTTEGTAKAPNHQSREWPMFKRGLSRTGYVSEVDPPTQSVTPHWKFKTGDEITSSPVVADGTVYIGSQDGNLYAVDAADGTQQWQFETDQRCHEATAVGDTVYLGCADGNLYAVDATTGDKQWQFQTDNPVLSSPAVVKDTVYVGSRDRRLYAVDAANGSLKWQFETGGQIDSSPAVVGRTVYVGSGDNSLYALNETDGTQRWQFETGDQISSSPAVADGTVYIGSQDGNLYAVDAADGTQQWQFETDAVIGGILSSPAVANGAVYVGGVVGNSLYAVDATEGNQRWRFRTSGIVTSSPLVASSTVFVGSGDSNLYALDVETGNKQWQFETGGGVLSSPAVVDSLIYIGSQDNCLYALSGLAPV